MTIVYIEASWHFIYSKHQRDSLHRRRLDQPSEIVCDPASIWAPIPTLHLISPGSLWLVARKSTHDEPSIGIGPSVLLRLGYIGSQSDS
jgi:hypothetical protein